MRSRILVLAVFLVALFAGYGVSSSGAPVPGDVSKLTLTLAPDQTPGPNRTYTASWTHNGSSGVADTFTVYVDGALTVTVPNADPACTGNLDARACTTPVTMTTNVAHVLTVRAVNIFGEASSDPFSAAPPARPAGVSIR